MMSTTFAGGRYRFRDDRQERQGHRRGGGPGGDTGHFIDADRGAAKLNYPIQVAAASLIQCHLGNIAHRVGRRLTCEAKSGRPQAVDEGV
jgi:hypothetical protein